MAKKLIICADGTWNNEDGAGGQTNVAKLHRILQNRFVETESQATRRATSRASAPGSASAIRGGAFGYGLSKNILEAYRFLVEHYAEGDQLVLLRLQPRGVHRAQPRRVSSATAACSSASMP